MPGPIPKDASVRQRRNKSASQALLPAESKPIVELPKLPARDDKAKWHPLAELWWSIIWASPQSAQFLQSDLGALFRLVDLVHRYWNTRSLEVAKELRMLEREFGLTPLSRRRLEWTVVQAEDAKDGRELGRARRAKPANGKAKDPREVLSR
jgi:hypothetical protein